MASTTRRVRYNRGSIDSTIRAAVTLASDQQVAQFVYATALGFTIGTSAPPFGQQHIVVAVDGSVTRVEQRSSR